MQEISILDMVLMGVGVLFVPKGFILGSALYLRLHSRAQLYRKAGIDIAVGQLLWGLLGSFGGLIFPLFVSFFIRDLFKSW